MLTNASLQLHNLSKHYAGASGFALTDVSLQVAAGEVYGFLGSNGAGKSTTIRLLLNFLQPSSGTASIMGKDIVSDCVEVKRHVGYLAGDVALYPKVTGRQLFAYLSHLQQQDTQPYLNMLISRFEAEPDKPIGELSKGNRQKIGIIQALMHKPDVLILDEPTSGLDPLMQEVFYETIRETSQRGTAVFISSHNLSETQRMCDRIGIIKHGKLIHEQSIKDDASFGTSVFRVVLASTAQVAQFRSSRALNIVSETGNIVTVQPTGSIADALKALSSADIKSFTTEQLSLEDEFLEYYGENQ